MSTWSTNPAIRRTVSSRGLRYGYMRLRGRGWRLLWSCRQWWCSICSAKGKLGRSLYWRAHLVDLRGNLREYSALEMPWRQMNGSRGRRSNGGRQWVLFVAGRNRAYSMWLLTFRWKRDHVFPCDFAERSHLQTYRWALRSKPTVFSFMSLFRKHLEEIEAT